MRPKRMWIAAALACIGFLILMVAVGFAALVVASRADDELF